MKLFNKREMTLEAEKKQSVDIVQVAYLESTLRKLQERINTETKNFDDRLKEQRAVYSEEKERLQREIKDLTNHLMDLRTERREQLVPVEKLKQEAEEFRGSLVIREKALAHQEEESDELLDSLHKKLDDISSRESTLAEEEYALVMKRAGLEEEAAKVSSGHQKLTIAMGEFYTEMEKRGAELVNKESSIKAREILIAETMEHHNKKIADTERLLADRSATLDRGFAELKRKTK